MKFRANFHMTLKSYLIITFWSYSSKKHKRTSTIIKLLWRQICRNIVQWSLNLTRRHESDNIQFKIVCLRVFINTNLGRTDISTSEKFFVGSWTNKLAKGLLKNRTKNRWQIKTNKPRWLKTKMSMVICMAQCDG